MKNYAILRDAVEEKVFGLVIEQDGGYRFYGADDRAKEWATWANSTSLKSLQEALPVGVIANDKRPLVNDTELFIESLIESASNSGEMKKSTFSYKGSHVAGAESSTPSARDFQLRSFDINARQNAINFKVFAFKNDQKSSSLMAKIRSASLGFNEKTGEFRSNDITISNSSLQQNIKNTYTKSLQRNIGFNIMAAKNIYAKSLTPFYTHPNVVELKRLGGAIGPKLGRGLRSAPMGMVFIDVTGAIDADKDGIVFEGKPGLERPIIPKFILPEGVGRRVASLIGGAAEQNEKNRRSGIVGGGAIDETKLRDILGADAPSLSRLNAPSPLSGSDNDNTPGMRSIAGNIRSRRDAIIGRRTSTDKLSRIGRGGKTQVNTGDSRAIEKMSWDDDAKDLIVTFAGGRTYTYKGVDDKWVKEIESNPDALGRIMNDIKKAGYDFEPGGEHASDKTLASRSQGRREAAGMRSARTGNNNPLKQSEVDELFFDNAAWSNDALRFNIDTDSRGNYDIEGNNPLSDALYREFPDRFSVEVGGRVGVPRQDPEVDFDYSNMSDEELGYFTDIIAENAPDTFDFIGESGTGMSSSSARRLTGTTWDDKTPKDGTPTEDDPFQFDFSADDLSEIDLSGANLSNAELGGKNLAGAKLNDINGSKIDLTDADLTRANMDRSDMVNAEMAGANLYRASLSETNLTDANLRGADLEGADLLEARLDNADLREANLTSAKLNAYLTNADLRKANLSNADLRDADLTDADLRDADLTLADLRGANLTGAMLTGADLGGAKLDQGWEQQVGMRSSSDNTTSRQKIYDSVVDMTGYDTEFGSDKGIREVADIVDGRWKKATPKERENYIASEGNATAAAIALAEQEGLLDNYDLSNQLDSLTPNQRLGMRSAKKPSTDDFMKNSFLPSLADRENYVASDEYEADLEDWLTRFPRKTEADFRRSKTFMENVNTFNPSPDVSEFSREKDIYDGWSPEEIDSGLPDILWRGMGSRTSNLTPEGKRDINDATKKLSDFSRSSSFGDVYPGAEKFDRNNRRHQSIYNMFEDADMPSQRVQDVLNADQALKEIFGEDSDVGMSDRMQYVLDHIAPTFDSRLALSRGVRRSNGSIAPNSGMGSRTGGAVRPAGFTQRSRTAMLETTAIGSPTGMRSSRENTKYKNVVPGQQRASTNDGKLWASLSPADKQLFAERARARESELIDMLFDKFDIPISGTDRRLLDDTLTPKERAKILKQTGGGLSWVTPNEDSPGHFLLNEEGLSNILVGEYSVRKKAKELAKQAREHLAKGEMKEHKDTVTKLTTLLRLGDDLQTLAGARLQGEKDSTLIDKNDSYDFAIDHIHPVSRTRIMDVGSTTATKGKNSAPKEKTNTYSKSGSNRPFEFNFSKAQMTTPSTAINIPGRPESSKDDLLRSAGVPGDDVKIKKASRVGGYLDFLRMKVADLSKADEKARERRIKKMRQQGINIGSVQVGERKTDRPSLLDKRAMKISRIARKKLLNAKARKMEALNKSAADNNDATALIASAESGATMLTPGGIVALSKDLKVGEREWKKAYNSKGRNDSGHSLAFVWEAAGMNGTPNPINEEEYKQLLAAGWMPIKRGTGARGYGISYMDHPKRFLPPAGEAYGPGEYWSIGPSTAWIGGYYPDPGELGDGPGGIAGLLPPTAKIMKSSELNAIREQHRAFSSPILGNFSGYTEGELEKTPQQDFVDQLVSDVFGKIPRDSAVWDSAIGQMTLQLISALESNPSPEEYKKLRNALFRLTTLVNQHENVYGPVFGADVLDVGSDVMLLMNRAAVSVFADPLPVDEILSLSQGRSLSPGYVVPGRK